MYKNSNKTPLIFVLKNATHPMFGTLVTRECKQDVTFRWEITTPANTKSCKL